MRHVAKNKRASIGNYAIRVCHSNSLDSVTDNMEHVALRSEAQQMVERREREQTSLIILDVAVFSS
jgi:hypothetical protein